MIKIWENNANTPISASNLSNIKRYTDEDYLYLNTNEDGKKSLELSPHSIFHFSFPGTIAYFDFNNNLTSHDNKYNPIKKDNISLRELTKSVAIEEATENILGTWTQNSVTEVDGFFVFNGVSSNITQQISGVDSNISLSFYYESSEEIDLRVYNSSGDYYNGNQWVSSTYTIKIASSTSLKRYELANIPVDSSTNISVFIGSTGAKVKNIQLEKKEFCTSYTNNTRGNPELSYIYHLFNEDEGLIDLTFTINKLSLKNYIIYSDKLSIYVQYKNSVKTIYFDVNGLVVSKEIDSVSDKRIIFGWKTNEIKIYDGDDTATGNGSVDIKNNSKIYFGGNNNFLNGFISHLKVNSTSFKTDKADSIEKGENYVYQSNSSSTDLSLKSYQPNEEYFVYFNSKSNDFSISLNKECPNDLDYHHYLKVGGFKTNNISEIIENSLWDKKTYSYNNFYANFIHTKNNNILLQEDGIISKVPLTVYNDISCGAFNFRYNTGRIDIGLMKITHKSITGNDAGIDIITGSKDIVLSSSDCKINSLSIKGSAMTSSESLLSVYNDNIEINKSGSTEKTTINGADLIINATSDFKNTANFGSSFKVHSSDVKINHDSSIKVNIGKVTITGNTISSDGNNSLNISSFDKIDVLKDINFLSNVKISKNTTFEEGTNNVSTFNSQLISNKGTILNGPINVNSDLNCNSSSSLNMNSTFISNGTSTFKSTTNFSSNSSVSFDSIPIFNNTITCKNDINLDQNKKITCLGNGDKFRFTQSDNNGRIAHDSSGFHHSTNGASFFYKDCAYSDQTKDKTKNITAIISSNSEYKKLEYGQHIDDNGYITCKNFLAPVSTDVAECWYSDLNNDLNYNDVVVRVENGLKKSHKRCQKGTIGCISDSYGFLLNHGGFDKNLNKSKSFPIAIAGRVKVKFRNNKIKIGDSITSFVNGMGIKANFFEKLFFSERVIGIFDSWDDKDNNIGWIKV